MGASEVVVERELRGDASAGTASRGQLAQSEPADNPLPPFRTYLLYLPNVRILQYGIPEQGYWRPFQVRLITPTLPFSSASSHSMFIQRLQRTAVTALFVSTSQHLPTPLRIPYVYVRRYIHG